MKNVLLIQPPFRFGDRSREPFFPIGLGYVAAALEKAGFVVSVLDIHAHQYSDSQVEELIKRSEFDVAGISALSTQYKYVEWLVRLLRKCHDRPVILGNRLATASADIMLQHTNVDVCVIGEGEATIVDLLQNLDRLEHVLGIAYRSNGEIVHTAPRLYIKPLDTIDFPAWHLFPMDVYMKASHIPYGPTGQSLNVITGRGCPYNCHFCSKSFEGIRLRSIENIYQEIKLLKERYGIKGIFFNDELLLISKKRGYQICEMMRELDMVWCCQGRVNVVDLPLLKTMRRSGCMEVGYGIESGSQVILNRMNKRINLEQSTQAIRNTIRAGLLPSVQAMFGYPGENWDTVKETIQFFRNIPYRLDMELFVTTPLPGTKLYEDALEVGLIEEELEFLKQLEWGYIPGGPLLVNFSAFKDEEFYAIKRQMQEEIETNFRKSVFRHPLFFSRVKLLFLSFEVRSDGILKTILHLLRRIPPAISRWIGYLAESLKLSIQEKRR